MRAEPTLEMCSGRCGARCCRAPLVLSATGEELDAMLAVRPDVAETHHGRTDVFIEVGSGVAVSRTIFDFELEPGEACPFLDQPTNRCTVYDVRPESCRGFPDRPEVWCEAWPGP